MTTPAKTIVIGIGNQYRSDDAAGLIALRKLVSRHVLPPGIDVAEHSGEAMTLIELWADYEKAIVIDAVLAEMATGTIVRFEVPGASMQLPRAPSSTHGLSIVEAVELAEALGRLPRKLVVYGIAGENFAPGEGLSAAVQGAIDEVARRVADELNEAGEAHA